MRIYSVRLIVLGFGVLMLSVPIASAVTVTFPDSNLEAAVRANPKDLRGLVDADAIIAQNQGEAIARIGTDVVRIRTLPPLPKPPEDYRERIIAESRRRYYRPARQIREAMRRRLHPAMTPLAPPASITGCGDGEIKELVYAEFPG